MILNISEAANLGIHAASYLASHPDETPVSTIRVAQALKVSKAHLSKVGQRMTRAGLLNSVRGPRGGFSLARNPESITLLEIFEAMDGPLAKAHCLLGHETCDRSQCVFGSIVADVCTHVVNYFTNTTLADLAE